MARGGIDLTQLALLGGGAYLFFTPQGRALFSQLMGSFHLTLPSMTTATGGVLTTGNPGHPSASSGAGDNPPGGGTGAADAGTWQGYKVDLAPAGRSYVVVRNTADGTWRYVTSPGEYAKYGVAANESNLSYVPYGSQPAFGTKENQPPKVANAFLRVDSPASGGLASTWPDIPDQGAAVSGLRAGYNSGNIYPQGAFGLAVLHYYGIV